MDRSIEGLEKFSEAEARVIVQKYRKIQKKNREKSAQMRDKKRAAGLVQVNLWTDPTTAKLLRFVAKSGLTADQIAALAACPEKITGPNGWKQDYVEKIVARGRELLGTDSD